MPRIIFSIGLVFGWVVSRPAYAVGADDRHPWEVHQHWRRQVPMAFADLYARFGAKSFVRADVRVGFEIEGHVARPPYARVSRDFIRVRNLYVQTLYPLIEYAFGPFAGRLSHSNGEVFAGARRLLSVDEDDSIEAPAGRLDLEINAPIFTLGTFEGPMTRFLRGLEAHDLRFTRKSGVHLHAEYPAGNVTSAELVLLANLWHVLQHDLFARFKPHRERAPFLEPVAAVTDSAPVGPLATISRRLELPDHSRFVDMAESLEKQGTIELRIINASFDRGPAELVYGTRLLAGLIWAVRTQEPGLKHHLTTTPPERLGLARIDEILGLTCEAGLLAGGDVDVSL